MTLGAADIAFATDLFRALPDLSTRRMFGGLGIYSGGVIFALMRSDAQLLIKAQSGPFADELARMGCVKWTYARKNGKESSMPYWTLPEAALDDPQLALSLAEKSLAAQR